MSENRIPNRVSMTFLPREPGMFKMHNDENKDTLATPNKGGRLASPLHLFDEQVKTWPRIDESEPNLSAKSNIIKKLQSAPASPRFADDFTKASSSESDHENNALDQRIDSAVSATKLYLDSLETYSDAFNTTKPDPESSPDATTLSFLLKRFPLITQCHSLTQKIKVFSQ